MRAPFLIAIGSPVELFNTSSWNYQEILRQLIEYNSEMIPREKSAAKKTVSTAMPVEAHAANKTARKSVSLPITITVHTANQKRQPGDFYFLSASIRVICG